MGNQPSAIESRGRLPAPHHVPHKLSKPRTGNHTTSNSLLSNRLSQLSTNTHPSHKTTFPSTVPPQLPVSLSSPVQSEAPLPHLPPPPISGRSLNTTTTTTTTTAAIAPARHYHQRHLDYSYDDTRDNPPTLGRRRSLFRSKSVNPDGQQERHRKRRNSFGLRRRDSTAYEPGANYYGEAITENWAVYPTQQRNPLNYDLLSYEAQRLLKLSEQQPAFGEEGSDMSETHEVSETTWKSSNPHLSAGGILNNGGLGGMTRINSDLSMYTTPIRRQSLRQPGIATRSSTVGHATHQETPGRHTRPSTPENPRRPSFMMGDDDDEMDLPLPPRLAGIEHPRVLTPCEDDYKQIGAFKLGSLRIVNGAASPSPLGSPSEKKGPRPNEEEGPPKKERLDVYFARKLGKTAGKFLAPKPGAAEGQDEDQERKPPPVPKDTTRIHSPIPSRPLPSPLAASFHNLDSRVSSGSLNRGSLSSPKLSKGTPETIETGESSPQIVLPSGYLAALEFSPLLLERMSSEELKTTSKLSAQEDQLFEDDQASDVFSTGPEVLDVRDDPLAKPDRAPPVPQRPKIDPPQRGSRTISRSDSGFVSSPTSDGASTHRSSGASAVSSRLTKADSGYSSSVSLRSFQTNSNHNSLVGKPPVPEKDFPPKRHSSSIVSIRPRASVLLEDPPPLSPDGSVLGPSESERSYPPSAPDHEPPPPPVPEKDFPPLSPTTSVNSSRFSRGSNQTRIASMQSRLSGSLGKSRQFMTPSPIPSQAATEPLTLYRTHGGSTNSPSSPLSPMYGRSSLILSVEKPKPPGRLRRLLSTSGLRSRPSKTELGLHPNRPLDFNRAAKAPKPAAASPVDDQQVQNPSTSQRLALKTMQSKDTLMTILNIGTRGVSTPDGELRRKARKIPKALVIPERRNTTAGNTTEQQSNPEQRRRREAPPLSHRNTIHETSFSSLQQQHLHASASYSQLEKSYASVDVEGGYFSGEEPRMVAASIGRTMSVSSDVERSIHMRVAAQRRAEKDARAGLSRSSSMTGYYDPHSPISSAPSPNTAYHRARTLSRAGSLRIPIPLRPGSISASLNQSEVLSRKASREAIHSFPSSVASSEDMAFVPPSRSSSRASMRSVNANPPPVPAHDTKTSASPSRSSSRTDMRSGNAAPPIPDYDSTRSPSRTNSISSDTGGPSWQPMLVRRESVSSLSDAVPPSRPASAAGYRSMSLRAPPSLRHRSSYDGPIMGPGGPSYLDAQTRQLAAELGAGRHTVYSNGSVDPWSVGHVSYGPSPFPWDQYGHGTSMQGRHPPYVPRQKRSRSQMRPGNVPYRVLHSYNSPAYKGAPIWG